MKEAEAAFVHSIALFKQLAADYPTRPEFRSALASGQNNLGMVLQELGRLKEAAESYCDALALEQHLVADFPNEPNRRNSLAATHVNLAILRLRQKDFKASKADLEQAEPYHEAALKANPRHPDYRRFYRNNLTVLIQSNAGLGDQAGAKQTAQRLRDFDGIPYLNAYSAARALSLCIPIVQKNDQATKEERDKQVQFYGDEAMKMLRDAIANGYKDVAHMKKDHDLDPLRKREDFKTLLSELEASSAKGLPNTK
jgi:tetratricopeptide (TPR) repeat protein